MIPDLKLRGHFFPTTTYRGLTQGHHEN